MRNAVTAAPPLAEGIERLGPTPDPVLDPPAIGALRFRIVPRE